MAERSKKSTTTTAAIKKAPRKLASYIAKRVNMDDIASSRGILCLLDQSGPTSQPKATKALGVSAGTCNLHFQRLEHEGLVRRVGDIRKGRGRPTITWDIEHELNFFVTIVFDTPFVQASLVDFRGTAVQFRREDLSALTTPAQLKRKVQQFLGHAQTLANKRGGKIRQAVVATPGTHASGSGIVTNAVNFPALNNFDALTLVREKLGVPCHTGVLGQPFYFGETENLSPDKVNMVIYWDLGIGLVFGRGAKLFTSDGALCGTPNSDPGHVRITKAGKSCHCGKKGCLEAYTGGWAILRELEGHGIESLEALIAAIQRDDPTALRVSRTAARTLGRNLVWPIQAMNVERIIVTGPLSPIFSKLVPSFCNGLGEILDDEEVASLAPIASDAPQERMQRGAFLMAKENFLHPTEALSNSNKGCRGMTTA
jgi:predicted NBD/HSP70 family sugar kinase